jgi:trimeric autotransporter adhesin
MMTQFTQAVRVVWTAIVAIGLSGCGEEKKAPSPPPPAPPATLAVGGSVSGLAGGELVVQLNGADDLTIKADGPFKFPKGLKKGSAYAVTVKTSPSTPVKQTCAVAQGSGAVAGTAVNNVAVTCTTNTFAVGGTVKGLSVKGKAKGLVLELKGVKEVELKKSGDFVFPDVRLPDGSDYNVAIKSAPKGQTCTIEAINTAPNNDTVNIVAVTCFRKGGK